MADDHKIFVLTMDLVPNFMSEFALRKRVSDHRWRKIIKKGLVAARGLTCEICHFAANESKHMDAHEAFEFPANDPIRLVSIQLLCTRCHDIKDFAQTERLIAQGVKPPERRQLVIEHFCHVNETTLAGFDVHYTAARRRVREIEKRYGPSITPDQVHYGNYHDHYLKARDPARFTGWTATQHAVAVAIGRGALHEDYREDAIEIARQDDQFRNELLCHVQRQDYAAATALVVEAVREYFDTDDPLPD